MAPSRQSPSPLNSILSLTGMEWRIGSRTAAFRLAALGTFLFGCAVGGEGGRGVGLAAYSTSEAAWQYLGFVAIVWMAMVAVRETTLRTHILVFSKPQPAERLALARFVGGYVQVLALTLAMFAGSICARLFSGQGLIGIEVYLSEYLRTAGALFFAASASYTLALSFDSALAGAMIGLYWILTLTGKAFLAKFYFPAYSQNLAAFLALSFVLLFLTLLFHGRARRGSARPALWVQIGLPVSLLCTILLFWTDIQNGHDPQARTNSSLLRMGEQDADVGSLAPGFLLPDQYGKQTGLSDFQGKILVIALWSPHDPDSATLLDRLNDVQAHYGAQGVQPLGVCLGENTSAAWTFAQGEHLQFPVVEDWGTYNAPKSADISPIAGAYRTTTLPFLAVTDRRRRIRNILYGASTYELATLEQAIHERLGEEPR